MHAMFDPTALTRHLEERGDADAEPQVALAPTASVVLGTAIAAEDEEIAPPAPPAPEALASELSSRGVEAAGAIDAGTDAGASTGIHSAHHQTKRRGRRSLRCRAVH